MNFSLNEPIYKMREREYINGVNEGTFDLEASNISAVIQARNTTAQSTLTKELEASKEFEKVLKNFDEYMKAACKSKQEREEERKAAQEKKDRDKRINELLALIGDLRSKLLASGGDPAVKAELAMYETELFWLTMSFQ